MFSSGDGNRDPWRSSLLWLAHHCPVRCWQAGRHASTQGVCLSSRAGHGDARVDARSVFPIVMAADAVAVPPVWLSEGGRDVRATDESVRNCRGTLMPRSVVYFCANRLLGRRPTWLANHSPPILGNPVPAPAAETGFAISKSASLRKRQARPTRRLASNTISLAKQFATSLRLANVTPLQAARVGCPLWSAASRLRKIEVTAKRTCEYGYEYDALAVPEIKSNFSRLAAQYDAAPGHQQAKIDTDCIIVFWILSHS
jgi:hypothetical protein